MKLRRVLKGETTGFPAPSISKGAGWIKHTMIEPGFVVVFSQVEAATGGAFITDREILGLVEPGSKVRKALKTPASKKGRK